MATSPTMRNGIHIPICPKIRVIRITDMKTDDVAFCDNIRGWDNMSISKIRSFLYKSSRILGDVQAAKNGTLGKRVARRAAGRATNKLLRSIFK